MRAQERQICRVSPGVLDDLWVPTMGLHTVVEYTRAQLGKSGVPVPHVTISTNADTENGPWAVAIEP